MINFYHPIKKRAKETIQGIEEMPTREFAPLAFYWFTLFGILTFSIVYFVLSVGNLERAKPQELTISKVISEPAPLPTMEFKSLPKWQPLSSADE
jgi:hypothetical protein